MASFKLLLSDYVKSDGKQTIELQIIVARKPIPRSTGFSVLKKDWDAAKERVKPSNSNFTEINDALSMKLKLAEKEFALTSATGATPSAATVADKTFATHDFYKFAEAHNKSLTGDTQGRSQKTNTSTINALKEFSPTLFIQQITPELIESFRKHLKKKGNARNTIISRLHDFRAIYNQSPHKRTPSPFEGVVIGDYRPAKIEPLTIAEIARLWNYQPETPGERLALDMFLMSYYCLGMRIGDVITLKWKDVLDDKILYDQGKKEHLDTDDVLEVPLNRFNDEILRRWPRTGKYVFGKITATNRRAIDKQVECVQTSINRTLKNIALKCKPAITKWMAGKVARKTYSDIANKRSNRNLYMIQMSLGHARIRTTEGYVGRDQAAINELAKKVYASPLKREVARTRRR